MATVCPGEEEETYISATFGVINNNPPRLICVQIPLVSHFFHEVKSDFPGMRGKGQTLRMRNQGGRFA